MLTCVVLKVKVTDPVTSHISKYGPETERDEMGVGGGGGVGHLHPASER